MRSVQEKAGYRFSKWIPTHNALDWTDGTLQCSEDLHHSFVLQDGLLKYCQEVLMRQTHTSLQSGSHTTCTKGTTKIDMISGFDLCWPEWHLFFCGGGDTEVNIGVNTWSSLTIMKQSRRSSPLRPNVPRVFWISENNLLLVTSWWLFRSYQVFIWSM